MIEVVAGIIYKGDKFLIAQRNLKKSQGGYWKFPVGKVEKNETNQEALKREIKEEFLCKTKEVMKIYSKKMFLVIE